MIILRIITTFFTFIILFVAVNGFKNSLKKGINTENLGVWFVILVLFLSVICTWMRW